MISFTEALQNTRHNRDSRNYPDRDDARCVGEALFPHFRPKFPLNFGSGTSIFTIGSCFARNIEEALLPLGVNLPTRAFAAGEGEWEGRPNGLLNEFNPCTIEQRVKNALGGTAAPEATIVSSGSAYADLLLVGGADVTLERAIERRAEIDAVYSHLPSCSAVIITLGLIEAWFDNETGYFLNRMPPISYSRSDRFSLQRLDVFDAMPPLERTVVRLANRGIKVLLTVSPVPLQTTFSTDDCVIASEYSKAVLRVCAERLSKSYANVDYFPSFEIVRSSGLTGYVEDNAHVRDELVHRVTRYMVESYSQATQPAG